MSPLRHPGGAVHAEAATVTGRYFDDVVILDDVALAVRTARMVPESWSSSISVFLSAAAASAALFDASSRVT